MAKKAATQRNRGSSSRSTNTRTRRSNTNSRRSSSESILTKPFESLDFRRLNGTSYKRMVRDISRSSPLLYIAGGIGAFLVGRFAYRYYQDHPEVSDFIKENVDTVESKLREFRGGHDEEIARH